GRRRAEADGRLRGRREVFPQWSASQAQRMGRSCRAAQRVTATSTHGWNRTYFWEKSLPTRRTSGYKRDQSSRSTGRLRVGVATPVDVRERELLYCQHLAPPLQ